MISFKNKNIGIKFFHSSILLIPGFLYALFSLAISSNRFFSGKTDSNILLLNIAQLLAFGITVAKYAADQMILSKLQSGETASLNNFFVKRVFPFTLFFCLIPFFSYGWIASLVLLFCIPIEVFVIITIIELNISKQYFKALFISMLGYPLVFLIFIFCSLYYHLSVIHILFIFLMASLLKSIIVVAIRRKNNQTKTTRADILITDSMVPIQQTTNYLLFKADQLIIASNFVRFSSLLSFLPSDYLFYTKFIELFSGITTSLAPMISGIRPEKNLIHQLIKSKVFALVITIAMVIQVVATVILLKSPDKLHLLMLIPFVLATMLIVPVTLINFEYYRTNNIKQANISNAISLMMGIISFGLSLLIKSAVLFSFIVPVQLLIFVVLYKYLTKRKG